MLEAHFISLPFAAWYWIYVDSVSEFLFLNWVAFLFGLAAIPGWRVHTQFVSPWYSCLGVQTFFAFDAWCWCSTRAVRVHCDHIKARHKFI